MILCDAGPLVALLDARQGDLHVRARAILPALRGPLLTTWPCFAEAMYLTGRLAGWPMQQLLWRMVQELSLRLHRTTEEETLRALTLMEQYRDVPMDLADATLMAAAESLRIEHIFTFDRDFFIYRSAAGKALNVVP